MRSSQASASGSYVLSRRVRSRSVVSAVAFAAVVGLTLAGCGSSSKTSNAGDAGSTTPATQGPSSAATAPGSAATPSSAPVSVSFTEIGKDGGKLPVYIAIDEGFMAKNGIDVKITDAHNGAAAVQAVLGNSTDIAETGMSNVIAAQQAGGDITVVAAESVVSPYTIEATKDIKTVKDLVGKKVAPGTIPTDISTIYFNTVLKANGVQPSQVKPIYVGGTAPRLAALEGGQVSASLLIPPANFAADAAGYHSLARVADFTKFPHTGFATSKKWAAAHKDTLVSFLKGYLQGVAWLYDPANHDQAAKILADYTGVSADVATKSVDYFLGINMYAKDGQVNLDALGKKMQDLGSLKKPYQNGSAVDMSYVTQAYAAIS